MTGNGFTEHDLEMAQRLAVIEADVATIKQDVRDIKDELRAMPHNDSPLKRWTERGGYSAGGAVLVYLIQLLTDLVKQ